MSAYTTLNITRKDAIKFIKVSLKGGAPNEILEKILDMLCEENYLRGFCLNNFYISNVNSPEVENARRFL